MSLPDLRNHQKIATAKLGKEFGTYADRVYAALQRTHDMASAGGGIPASSFATTTEQLTGTDAIRAATPDSIAALWEKGADVASAGTISLAEGGFFHVTGTTTITDIDFAVDKSGRMVWVEFTGILILTHNATTLILPTGANITTAAGDTACFISEGSDAVRCVAYQRKDGTALASSGGGYTDEMVDDRVAALLVAGTNVTLTYNDGANTLTVAAASGGLSAGTPPTIVQYGSSLESKSVVLGIAPTNGNLLVAIVKAGSNSWGAGWTQQELNPGGVNYNNILTKVAGGGESTTQTPLGADDNADAICMWELNGQSATPVVFAHSTILSAGNLFFTCGPPGPLTGNAPTSMPGLANVLALAAIFNDGTTPQTLTAAMNMTQNELSNSGTYTHFVSGHSDGATPVAQLLSRCTGATVATRAGIIHITS